MKKIRMQQKFDLEANFIAENPEVLPGEIVISTDFSPVKYKVGEPGPEVNGGTRWNNLPYFDAGSGASYTNPVGIPTALGGYEAGTTFLNKSFDEMWQGLLYPYQYPNFTSFYATGLGVKEVGYTYPAGNRTFTWVSSNDANVQPFSISIEGDGMSTITGLDPDGNTSIALNLLRRLSPGTASWTARGTNTNGDSYHRSYATVWRYRMNYGNFPNKILTESDVLGLNSNPTVTSFTGTKNFPAAAGNYKVITYPVAFGTATVFKDTSTNIDIPMDAPYEVEITNLEGVTYNVRIHVSVNKLGGEINMLVS